MARQDGSPPMDLELEERRSLERRVFELEQKMSSVLTQSAVTAAQVSGLVETIKSRFQSFDRGIDLILERLKTGDARISTLEEVKGKVEALDEVKQKVEALEEMKNKMAGAFTLVQVLGVVGIVGGVVAIIRMVVGQ